MRDGVRSIDHGYWPTRRRFALMKEHGTCSWPTATTAITSTGGKRDAVGRDLRQTTETPDQRTAFRKAVRSA